MSRRSSIGCYACKLKRKKCDEMKPKCLRCAKSGVDCKYEYIQLAGSKVRTKPAPRPPSERNKALLRERSSLTTTSVLGHTRTTSDVFSQVSEPRLASSLNATAPLDTTQAALLYKSPMLPSPDPMTTTPAPIYAPMISHQPVASRGLTSGQASLFIALFSLGNMEPPVQSGHPSESLQPAPPVEPDFGISYTPTIQSSFRSPLVLIIDEDIDGVEDNNGLEGMGEILYPLPVEIKLDSTVDSNQLPFVLQSYSQWIMQTVFDPLKIIYPTKSALNHQFSLSLASRSRLISISGLMRRLVKHTTLDEGGKRALESLRNEIWEDIATFQGKQWPAKEEREHAVIALSNTFEMFGVQATSTSLATILRLLQLTVPVFLSACPSPYPPRMSDILLETGVNLKHFMLLDVVYSITTGRSLLCRYHVPWSLEYCEEFLMKREERGSQCLFGLPDQFLMLFAYMQDLREDAKAANTMVDPPIIRKLEEDLSTLRILPYESREPALAITRTILQECWRQAVFIYLYMALDGSDALNSRVEMALKRFMKLVGTLKPRRRPGMLFAIPMIIAGVAATKSTHRQTIISYILSIPECANPNTMGNDYVHILKDIWTHTTTEGRGARWQDLREACWRVTRI